MKILISAALIIKSKSTYVTKALWKHFNIVVGWSRAKYPTYAVELFNILQCIIFICLRFSMPHFIYSYLETAAIHTESFAHKCRP